jgi:DNA invertase Pin-like site-specific DNA recombinase
VQAAAAGRKDEDGEPAPDIIAHTYKDWGRSGGAEWDDLAERRPEFTAMLGAVAAGTIGAVYAYDADRLSRNESILHRLLDVAGRSGTVVIDRTGRDLASSHNRLTAGILASVDAQVLRDITERNRANRDRKRARGDDLGEAPYGWTKVKLTEPGANRRGRPAQAGAVVNVLTDEPAIVTVLNAYAAAGSALGAAVLLNAAGVPTRRGRTWNNRAVADVVAREAPELLPAKLGRRNARHYRIRALSGLLRCRCGNVMSPNGEGWTCAQGQRGAHERPYNVAESKLLPWVKAEAGRLALPEQVTMDAGPYDDGAERAALAALRGKVSDAVVDAGLADLDAARAAHGDRVRTVVDVPARIDFEREDVADVNRTLRAMWSYVELGPDLMPVSASWRVPEWRRP